MPCDSAILLPVGTLGKLSHSSLRMFAVGTLVVGGAGGLGLEAAWCPALEEWGDRVGWRYGWVETDKRVAREFLHGPIILILDKGLIPPPAPEVKKKTSPGGHGSVGWALFCRVKGHWFDSWSGHMPGLWVRSPVGGAREATIH